MRMRRNRGAARWRTRRRVCREIGAGLGGGFGLLSLPREEPGWGMSLPIPQQRDRNGSGSPDHLDSAYRAAAAGEADRWSRKRCSVSSPDRVWFDPRRPSGRQLRWRPDSMSTVNSQAKRECPTLTPTDKTDKTAHPWKNFSVQPNLLYQKLLGTADLIPFVPQYDVQASAVLAPPNSTSAQHSNRGHGD